MKLKPGLNQISSRQYVPNLIRSRPFRCISLPVVCMGLFIAFWFVFCPLLFDSLLKKEKRKEIWSWPEIWPIYFWLVSFLVFIVILAALIYLWRRKPIYEVVGNKIDAENQKQENECKALLEKESGGSDSVKSKHLYSVSFKTVEKETESYVKSSETSEPKKTTDTETKHYDTELEIENEVKEILKGEAHLNDLQKDLDRLFPRCSLRRKTPAVKAYDKSVKMADIGETSSKTNNEDKTTAVQDIRKEMQQLIQEENYNNPPSTNEKLIKGEEAKVHSSEIDYNFPPTTMLPNDSFLWNMPEMSKDFIENEKRNYDGQVPSYILITHNFIENEKYSYMCVHPYEIIKQDKEEIEDGDKKLHIPPESPGRRYKSEMFIFVDSSSRYFILKQKKNTKDVLKK